MSTAAPRLLCACYTRDGVLCRRVLPADGRCPSHGWNAGRNPDAGPGCTCMLEDDGSIETPGSGCPEHGYLVDPAPYELTPETY